MARARVARGEIGLIHWGLDDVAVVRPVGGEVLSALAVAVHAEVTVSALRHMIYAYPTFHRGIEDALRQLG